MVKLAANRTKARFNIAKALAISKLSETHRQKLIPAGKTLLLIVAPITRYALLELISRKMLHKLRENGLAKVYPSLSAIDAAVSDKYRIRLPVRNNSNRKIHNPHPTTPISMRYREFKSHLPDSSGLKPKRHHLGAE